MSNLEECPQFPEDSIVSEGNCDFQNDLCNEWVLPESPEQSFFNRTSGNELKNSGIIGPEMDELDNADGSKMNPIYIKFFILIQQLSL